MAVQLNRRALTGTCLGVDNQPVSLLSQNGYRKQAIINNLGPGILYISGSSDVSATRGFPLNVGQALVIENPNELFAVASQVGTTVGLLEERS